MATILTTAKNNLTLALIHLSDEYKKQGQNGVISSAIIASIKESIDEKTIRFIVEGLSEKPKKKIKFPIHEKDIKIKYIKSE